MHLYRAESARSAAGQRLRHHTELIGATTAALAAACAAAIAGAWSTGAHAAIVIDAQATPSGIFRLSPFADGGGPDSPEEPIDTTRAGQGPSFVVSTKTVSAFRSGKAGTANAHATGSTDSSFGLADDALTFHSTASFNDDASFSPAADPRGTGVGSATGDFRFSLTLSLSDRPYVYSYTWRSDSLQGGLLAESRTEATVQFSGASAFSTAGIPRIPGVSDVRAQQGGSHTFATSADGVLDPRGELTISLHLAANASTAGSDGTTHTQGSYDFQLGIAPGSRWINPSGGAFHTDTNWSANLIPGTGGAAIYDLPGTYTVGLDRSVTNAAAHFHGNGTNVTLDLNGNNYTVDELAVGGIDGDNVRLRLQDSGGIGVSAARAAAGAAPPAAAVRAASMRVRGSQTVEIAAPTTSNLVVIDGGGSVSASSAAAQWTAQNLFVGGSSGAGSMGLSNKATLVSHSSSITGFGQTKSFVIVTGTDSRWTCDNLAVGDRGVLDILNNASVLFQNLNVGLSSGDDASVTVDGVTSGLLQGSSADATAVIGGNGTGRLKVTNGGLYQAPHGTLTIGNGTGAGDVAVSAAGTIVTGPLTVGKLGTGVLTLNDRAAAVVFSGAAVVGGSGQVAVNANSDFDSRQSLQVDGIFRVDPATGRAIVGDDPGNLGRGKLFVTPNGTLSGTGTICGRLVLAGGASGFGGEILPGNSPGTLTVAGDFEQHAGGLLGIQIAGTAPRQFDVLAITGDPDAGIIGNATIGGDLSLEFLDGFAPHTGDRFDFLTATGALTGQFQHVDVRGLAPGFQFDLKVEDGRYALVALSDGVVVPEPAAGLLLLTPGALLRRRRRWHSRRG
jgi:hypothetical protein